MPLTKDTKEKDPIKFDVSKELHRKFKKDYSIIIGNMCQEVVKTLAQISKPDLKKAEDDKDFHNGGKAHNVEKTESEKDYSKSKSSMGAFFYEGKLLILQRGMTDPWMPNCFSLPGGGLEEGENIFRGLIRETKEETGLHPDMITHIKTIKSKSMGEINFFAGRLLSDKVELCTENQSYQFISANQIDDFKFIPNVKKFLKELFKTS